MKRSASWLVSGAMAILGVAACAATPSEGPVTPSAPAAVPAPAVAAPAPALATAPAPAAAPVAGQQILEAQCQTCHDLGMVTSIPRRAGDWPEILQRMQGYGASLSRADQAVLLDYLVKTHSTAG